MIIASAVALAAILALVIVLAVQCGQDEPDTGDNPPAVTVAPEVGTYYFDASIQEYTLTLNEGNTFALFIKGETFFGLYTLKDGKLSLDFTVEGKATLTAELEGDVVSMTYDGASYRLLKKTTYTVSFETGGGSMIPSQPVVNGKTANKPADPTRVGYVFVGWYADSAFKTPYAFGAAPVTANVTVYARWSAVSEAGEFDVELNENYEDAAAPEVVRTVGGKLFDLPTPTRDGYVFGGWWISMADNGEKLTCAYQDGMVIKAETTLYALWQQTTSGSKLAAPIVNVTGTNVSWTAVTGAKSYNVKVISEAGVTVLNQDLPATTLNVDFAQYAAGEYEIVVTAIASTVAEDNSEATRYYTNKALDRVTGLCVIDSMLIFNTVQNATKYLITVECGNADHQHTAFDNGNSRSFNFENCVMQKGGIKFTVTAVAQGYASSTSKTFVYERALGEVTGFAYDAKTQTVTWNEIENARFYMVSVTCGNAAHDHSFLNNGSSTSVSLKDCDALEGGIVIKVYPKTHGYTSPEATEYKVTKETIATPSNITLNGTVLSWNAVTGAEKYEVKVGDTTYETTTPTFDLSAALKGVEGTAYTVSVRAIGESESLWSDAFTAAENAMSGTAKYTAGVLSWNPVIGAASYELQVNDGEIVTVSGACFAPITLTRAGVNVLKVRFVDGTNRSEWVTVEVYAHAVIFDARGGSAVDVQYKAVGDKIALPVTEKEGYTFKAWYNVPGGAACNGLAYTDEFFAESGAIVLYAYYTPVKYDLTYNYGEGGSSAESSAEVSFEQNYQLTVPTANSTTSVFGGWFTAPYGMGVQLTDAKGNSLAPWTSTEGATVYAFWIDSALEFTKTKVNGKDGYMVSAGERIALLTEVTIPATHNGLPVLMVAGNAFKDCTSLTVINLPSTLEQISNIDPFGGCLALEAVNVYGVSRAVTSRYWSEDGVLFDNGTGTVAQPKLLFMPLAKTGTYRIPDGISEIPEGAFANCALSRVIIPTSVTKIGAEAFANATKLSAVTFETGANEQALTIAKKAFSGCTALEKIMLPARLSNIVLTKYVVENGEVNVNDTNNAFVGCTALVSIQVANSSTTYKSVDGVLYTADGKTLLYCPATKAGAFSIPSGTQAIAPGAFIGCNELTEVTLPNTITLVGECAFYGLESKLEKVTFAEKAFNDTIVEKYAFRGCAALEEVVFGAGSRVSTLGEGAFYGCKALESFTVPTTMTFIGAEAFRDCIAMETLSFAPNGKTLAFGEDVFYGCTSLESVDLPLNVSTIPGIFNGCTSLVAVNVAEGSQYLTSKEGVVYNKEMTEILFFPQGKTGEFILPETVTTIANGVFRNVKGLSKLTIYNTIAVIGAEAFRDAKITEIVFVDHDTAENATALVIGDSAFRGVSTGNLVLPVHTTVLGTYSFRGAGFSSITLNEGLVEIGYGAFQEYQKFAITIPATVKTIGDYAFYNSYNLGYSYRDGYVKFAENSQLESIGDHAFASCTSLRELTLPATLVEIGAYAFEYSYDLRYVTFAENGSLKVIGAHAFDGCSDLTYGGTLTIPATVTEIGAYAFYGCSYMKYLAFEDAEGAADLILGAPYSYTTTNDVGATVTVTERGHVFENCTYLEGVSLPARLVEIAEYSFYRAGKYGYNYSTWEYEPKMVVTFAENSRLMTIGAYAFANANMIGELIIPASVQNLDPVVNGNESYDRLGIGENAFYGTALTKITFAAGGEAPLTIGKNAFGYINKLIEITLPARLADYTSYTGDVIEALAGGAATFKGNGINSLTGELVNIFVEDAEGATYVDIDGVLYKTNGTDVIELIVCPAGHVNKVSVPATVTKIHDLAFGYCRVLTEIELGEFTADVTVGNEAFIRCEQITTLVLPENVVSVGRAAFEYCKNLTTLTLSAKLERFDGAMVASCKKLANIYVGKDNSGVNYSSLDGVLFNADKTEIVMYPGAHEATEFTVPDTVKVIGANTFANNEVLEKVTLPEGLVEIGANAFLSCSALGKVNIPSTVTVIGEGAFNNCTKLVTVTFAAGDQMLVIANKAFQQTYSLLSIELPARLLALGDYAFSNSGLAKLYFAENGHLATIGDSAFNSTDLVSLTLPGSLATIGSDVFFNCASLVSVTFEEGLTAIGNGTFNKCTALTEVHFPSTLRTMGVNTFFYRQDSNTIYACTALTTVTFGANPQLQVIPAGTFAYTALTSFEIPATVKAISYDDLTWNNDYYPGAFEGCASLEILAFAEGTQCATIGHYAFKDCSALKFVTIPTSVSTLGESAFEACTALQSITIPETCTNLGYYAFGQCTSLANVVLKTKATELADYLFVSCSSLTSITIPETVTKIGSSCFSNTALVNVTVPASVVDMSGYGIFSSCEKLESVTILGNVTEIGKRMFEGCTALSEIVLPNSVKAIREDAFAGCVKITVFTIPAALETLESAFTGSGLAKYEVAAGNTNFTAVDGVLFNADLTKLLSYPANKPETTFTIPKEVTEIADSTFANITTLREVIFEEDGSEKLTIGEGAFYGCTNLQLVNLPDRLTSIGYRAFYNCQNLMFITLPSTLKEIGTGAFSYCNKLMEVCNLSGIEMSLDEYYYSPGDVLYYAKNYYTATEGASKIAIDENGFVTYTDEDEMYLIGYVGNETEVVVPGYVTNVYKYAFLQTNVTKLTLSEGVLNILEKAVYECNSLVELVLPASLEYIDSYAIYKCAALSKLELPGTLDELSGYAFYYCEGLKEVIVPASIGYIGSSAFYGCSNLTLLVREEAKGAEWSSSWNGSCQVIYGWDGAEHTYVFNTNGGDALESITSSYTVALPTPTFSGMVFMGWYEDEACEGTVISGAYYNKAESTTLYAKWMTEEEYQIWLNAGTSFKWAIEIAPGETLSVVIDEGGERVYFVFTPTESGSYSFYSIKGSGQSTDTYGHMYNDSQEQITTDDDGAGSSQFKITYECEAGKTYYFVARLYSGYYTGQFTVALVKN